MCLCPLRPSLCVCVCACSCGRPYVLFPSSIPTFPSLCSSHHVSLVVMFTRSLSCLPFLHSCVKLMSVLCSIVFCFIVTVLNSMFGVFSSASSVSLCLICLSCVPRVFPVSSSFLVYLNPLFPSVQCHNLPHGCVFLHVPLCMFSFLQFRSLGLYYFSFQQ